MGYCGNAVLGLKNGSCELVMPKVEDCITLLLGSQERRRKMTEEEGTYFLTKGWIQGGRTIWNEYEHLKMRCGAVRAVRLLREMMKNYSRLVILDTGAYKISEVRGEVEKTADILALRCQTAEGTVEYLKELVSGPWPEQRFLTVPAGMTVTEEALTDAP